MDYKISQEAYQDLESIWVYTFENWSIEQADRYIDLIMDEITYLAVNPKSGKDYGHIRQGYYRSQVKSHLIFYKISEEIEVIRILHKKMDIDARLNEF